MERTFLTKAQQRVLEFRAKGMSQAEIARILKTSRANISILERRARENVARAEQTVKLAAKLRAPIILKVEEEADLFSLPKQLFERADKVGIRVKLTAADIVTKIRQEAGNKIHGRSVTKPFEMAVTSEGDIIIT
jgi:hypothetical protein